MDGTGPECWRWRVFFRHALEDGVGVVIMKRTLIVLSLLFAMPAWADGMFHIKPENRLAVSSVAILADTLTTYVALKQPRVHEANPILGKHPSVGKQALFAALKLGGNWYVQSHTSGKTQLQWTWIVVGVEGAASVNNLIVLSREW